jgi:hypothetical protein
VATRLQQPGFVLAAFDVPISWSELFKRTLEDVREDDCFGLAAQLPYYFFLALFPAILFILSNTHPYTATIPARTCPGKKGTNCWQAAP